MKKFIILGMMTGTSADGIDAKFCISDGIILERKPFDLSSKFSSKLREKILEARNNPQSFLRNISKLKELDLEITMDHIRVIKKICKKFSLIPDYIGVHGQTIFHNPKDKISIQLGDGKKIAKMTGINTVYDFRKEDILNGGQGAPLAPIYHQMIINSVKIEQPAIFLNLGGIANITLCNANDLYGYDIGPGNCLIDDICYLRLGKNFDKGGKIANAGKINFEFVNKALKDPYFLKQKPKSLDRSAFNYLLHDPILNGLSNKDAVSSITYFTSKYIIEFLNNHIPSVKSIIISGGGIKNITLLRHIKKEIKKEINLYSSEQIGGDSQMIEAELIAFLTARKINNLPSTFPETTGVKTPQICGSIAYPS